ncbi:MAG: sensor histidine kinase [Rhodospirillaceae bacterium]|nr:sensor histidine kinase [Rhodospirillaceae bacterium]
MARAPNQSSKNGASSLRRLRAATLLLFTSFVLLVISAGAYYLEQQRQAAIDTARRTARAALDTVQYQAAQTFGDTLRMSEGVADVYREQLAHNQVNEATLHQLMSAKLPRMQGLVTFTLFDTEHHGIAGSRSYPVDVSMIITSGMSFETFADIGDDMFFGQLYRNIRPGLLVDQWFLPFGKIVRDAGGIVRGYVVALFNANFFAQYYATLDPGAHGQISIWSADGLMLAASRNESRGAANAAMAEEMRKLRDASDGRTLTYVQGRGDNESKVTALGLVGALPVFVAVEMDGRDFMAPWRATRNQIFLAMAVVILGAAAFAVIILRQIHHTEQNELALRHAKALAEDASDAKSRFLAHMSHEFRTPLNAIMGFSEIIKNQVLGGTVSPDYVGYAAHIHRSGEHLLHIVNEILDTAKIELGGEPLQQKPTDIRTLVLGAIGFVEGLAAGKNLKLSVALPNELPMIASDERFVRQVLINLMSNAIKFSPSGAEIVIGACNHPESGVTISVSDHGPGIEPSLLKRLGEPFLQGNPALSHSGQGTGLGLSICKRYMDLLDGELKVESTLGSGTTATIRFPRHLIAAAAEVLKSPLPQPVTQASAAV